MGDVGDDNDDQHKSPNSQLAHTPDPRGRTVAMTDLRSINLNISSRGLSALESVDPALAETLLAESIPMPSRMIHHLDGRMEPQLYDPLRGNCSNSISRSVLNQRMLEALPEGINIQFNTKLTHVDYATCTAHGVRTAQGAGIGEETEEGAADHEAGKVETRFDLVVGADGSWSKVRADTIRAQRWVSLVARLLTRPGQTFPRGSLITRTSSSTCPRTRPSLTGLLCPLTTCISGRVRSLCLSPCRTRFV
jgi:2-polyprenyl-6-methoxyphenol hydroxylase-like FAD-dependent oxidoreductase